MNANQPELNELRARVAELEAKLAEVTRERDRLLLERADAELSDEEFLRRIEECKKNPVSMNHMLEALRNLEYAEGAGHARMAG